MLLIDALNGKLEISCAVKQSSIGLRF